MTRRIVQLAGHNAQYALADDGSVWYWNGQAWQDWGRGGLPERVDGVPDVVRIVHVSGTDEAPVIEEFYGRVAPGPAPPLPALAPEQRPLSPPALVKRGPGRPRKNPL